MNKKLVSILSPFIIIVLLTNISFGQLTITITDIPENTPKNDDIYIASSLSNWSPSDAAYKLNRLNNNEFQITLHPSPGTIKYKFTRGDWSLVESNELGQDISNRVIKYDGSPMDISVKIAGWKIDEVKISTAAKNVTVLKEKYYIPNLDRERRVWIYLPPDYNTTKKKYPVIYMHDGQNLFDASTSFSGEWEVDETLNNLFESGDEGVIIVGVENGGATRTEEYTPWSNEKYGGGRGGDYVDFLVTNLKPFVDGNYRTKPDRSNTGIMGSSLGGLISFYGAIKHQDVFGKAGVFSPSFWFSDKIYGHVENIGKNYDMEIYLLGGELESETLIQEMDQMVAILKKVGFEDKEIKMISRADGDHNEAFWAREFSKCYTWLFR